MSAAPPDVRAIMGSYASAVTVMTTVLADGQPHGMTANAVSSVSLDPPLALVCVDKSTRMADWVVTAGCFALTFLTGEQEDVSNRFADPSRPFGAAEFEGLTTAVAVTGALVIEPHVGWVDCQVWDVADGGDHLVVLGEVVAGAVGEPGDALVYYRRGYHVVDGG